MVTVEQEYRDLLPRLLRAYPTFLAGEVRFHDSHAPIGHVAHGWYMRCHRGVEAVLMLEQVKFQVEAAPIRRSVLEHAVALKWLAGQGGVVADILRRGAAHDATKRKAAIQAADWTSVDVQLFDAIIQDGQGLDPQHDTLLSFKHRCDRYGNDHDWVMYLTETTQSHPCWESAAPYLVDASGKGRPLYQPENLIDQAGFCATHLLEALMSINKMVESAALDAELQAIKPLFFANVVRQRGERGLPIPAELQDSEAGDEQTA